MSPPDALDGVAFFDVDETLLNIKTMADFLPHFLSRRGQPDATIRETLRRLAQIGESEGRQAASVAYYRLFNGERAAEVDAVGEDWFAQRVGGDGFFRTEAVNALLQHTGAGHRVVLVSGSFLPILAPVARALGVPTVLCTQLRIREGVYTGAVETAMIGDGKARAVRRLLSSLPAPPPRTWAYGDHSSDADMMSCVDTAVVVGTDPELRRIAAERGWSRLTPDGLTQCIPEGREDSRKVQAPTAVALTRRSY